MIQQIIDQVRHAINLEDKYQKGRGEAAESVKIVSDAVRRTAYQQAFDTASSIDLGALDAAQVEDLDRALSAIYRAAASEKPDFAISVCDLWVVVSERLLSFDPARADKQERVAAALVSLAYCRGASGDNAGEVKLVEDLDRRFGASLDPKLRRTVAQALVNRMRRLNGLDRGDDLEQAYCDLIERFEGAPMVADVIDSAFLCRNDFAGWTELDLPRLEVIWQSRDADDKGWGQDECS